jgi:hypothetical protein
VIVKRNIFIIILIAIISSVILTEGISSAVTVTAMPNPASVNQNVSINVTAQFQTTPIPTGTGPCSISTNFGDGSPLFNQNCTTTPCSVTINHVYVTPGTFVITATAGCSPDADNIPISPNPGRTMLIVSCPPLNMTSPSTLPSSTIGQVYTYQILTSGGQPPVTYSLVSGSLPQGLNLSPTGLISGTPTTQGSYSFTVEARDNCSTGAQNTQRAFSIQIQAPPIIISVIPSSFTLPRGQSSSKNVSYQFTASSPLNTTLTSSGGNFIAGGETVEVNTIPLTVPILNGYGRASEMITIPVAVIERAIQRGSNRFSYIRTFTGSNINLNATVNFTITTEAGAEFDIKRIELYFENRRAEITIERDYPDLKAYVDIRFVGSGLLHGYWEVDGRVLSHVDQHLTFGKMVTLQTPEIPPLPTFDTGTHIVRFVITNPVTDIPLPSILYFVTPTEFKGKPVDIKLVAPENESGLKYLPIKFEWEKLNSTLLFLIQFFDNPDSKPIFSAYTKEPHYLIPELYLDNIFSPGQKYYWKVTGFDEKNNIVGESTVWKFLFK